MSKTADVQKHQFVAVFDMNGTLLDDAPYQRRAWQLMSSSKGRTLTDEEFRLHIAGHKEADALSYVFGSDLSAEAAEAYSEEKRRIYRETLGPVMREIPGLSHLLEELQSKEVQLALATSGSSSTIDFILDTLNLRRFFPIIVQASQVARGKPAPDIFLFVAKTLGVDPCCCVVIEDSLAGLQSARSAGMKTIGISTSLSIAEILGVGADMAVCDFQEVSFDRIWSLFEDARSHDDRQKRSNESVCSA